MKKYVYFISYTGVNAMMQPASGNMTAKMEQKINTPEAVTAITQGIVNMQKLRSATIICLSLLDEIEEPATQGSSKTLDFKGRS